MSIKFICSCGKRLRARDDMATRRSVCPRCGNPVGIPSLQPTHRGAGAGPMSPAERLRTRWYAPTAGALPVAGLPTEAPAGAAPDPPGQRPGNPSGAGLEGASHQPVDASQVRLVVAREPRPSRWRRYPLEAHWSECLFYPFLAWRLLLLLALALTVLTGCTALLVPEVLRWQTPSEPWSLLLLAPWLLVPLFVLDYTCGWLESVLASAAAGEVEPLRCRGRNVGLTLTCGVRWLVCFLAGPVVPAAASLLYWIYGGDPAPLDWLIRAELGTLAVGYWVLVLVAVSRTGRLRDANPVRVLALVQRLGSRGVVTALVAAGLALAHGWLAVAALERLHTEPAKGWLWLAGCCVSGLFWGTFLFRVLGLWCFRLRL
jgi:hypothetical protein